MKKSKLLLATLALSCITAIAFSQTEKKYKINGTILHMPPPEKVYLYGIIDGKYVSDSATVKDGTYHFLGTTSTQTNMTLRMKTNSTGTQITPLITIIIDEGEINVLSDGSFDNVTLSGSNAQATIDYRNAIKRTKALSDSVMNVAKTEAAKGHNYNLQQSIDILVKSQTSDIFNFLKTNPNTPASPFMALLLSITPNFPKATVDSLIASLPAKQQVESRLMINNQIAMQNAGKLKQGTDGLGKPAADFTLADVNGKPVSLSLFKGHYVLIDFWASWCAPCRAENPNVVKVFQEYKDKGLNILGVSLDAQSSKSAWIEAIKKDGLTWTQVSDLKGWQSNVAQLYHVTSIPQNFLIDPNGVIIAKNLRGKDLEEKLAFIFNK